MERGFDGVTPNILPTGTAGPIPRLNSLADENRRPLSVSVSVALAFLQFGAMFVTVAGTAWSMVNQSQTGHPAVPPGSHWENGHAVDDSLVATPLPGINYPVYVAIIAALGLILLTLVQILRARAWAAYTVVGLEVSLMLYGVTFGIRSGALTGGEFAISAAIATTAAVGLLTSSARAWYAARQQLSLTLPARADFPTTLAVGRWVSSRMARTNLGLACVVVSSILSLKFVDWQALRYLQTPMWWVAVFPIGALLLTGFAVALSRSPSSSRGTAWKLAVIASGLSLATMLLWVHQFMSYGAFGLLGALSLLRVPPWPTLLGYVWILTACLGLPLIVSTADSRPLNRSVTQSPSDG